jgi:RNase P/RNase MRP subunit p30
MFLQRKLKKNNVAIELSFSDILNSYLSYRSKILSNFKDIYALYRKFKFPLIVSSRAKSIFDIKTPRDIKAFFITTGLTESEFDNAMNSSKIF